MLATAIAVLLGRWRWRIEPPFDSQSSKHTAAASTLQGLKHAPNTALEAGSRKTPLQFCDTNEADLPKGLTAAMWEADSDCRCCDVDAPYRWLHRCGPVVGRRVTTVASSCLAAVFLLTLATFSLPSTRTAVSRLLPAPYLCGPEPETLRAMRRVRRVNGTFVAVDGDASLRHEVLRCGWEHAVGAVPSQCCCGFEADGLKKCFPHVIVVGAQKAGTTAVLGHLLTRDDFERAATKEIGCVQPPLARSGVAFSPSPAAGPAHSS